MLARQAAYQLVDYRTRKDLVEPQGLLDHRATTFLLRKQPKETNHKVSAQMRFHSVVVGCALTRDRLAAAGWVNSSQCRFCHCTKESLHHLVHECHVLHQQIGKPIEHELGVNFCLLGIIPHPWFLARRRLMMSVPREPAFPFNPDFAVELRRDGSVLWSDRYWLVTATYAIVNDSMEVCTKGAVNHLCLSSYTAELWGLVQACLLTPFPFRVHIYRDCQSVVGHAKALFSNGWVRWLLLAMSRLVALPCADVARQANSS